MKQFCRKLWIYLRPFVSWQFLVSYFIPFMLINGGAWIGSILLPIVGPNWFTVAATTWLAISWLPWTPEKLITIPIAIWIHTKLFGRKGVTHYRLLRMYAQAKRDWKSIKNKFKRNKDDT